MWKELQEFSGKSTLALELCKRQKEIKSMAKFSLVLLFQLRDKDVQMIQKVEDLFRHDDVSLQQSVTKEVINSCGKDVLFILDGFDELPDVLRKNSFFVNLIQGKHLPACTVLVTSRPSASANILQSINNYKYVEVLGFTQTQIEEYATSMLKDQPDVLEDFLKYIFVNPAIRGMMYIPLNSAIVLHIYRKNRAKGKTFPRTMTQLYTELCLVLLKKYLKEQNESDLLTDQLNTTDLGELPKNIKKQLCLLGELAFNGALSREITFEQLPSDCDDLGLLNVSTGLYLGRKSYSFLHLTLQEFLAGYYFSQLSPAEQELNFINNLIINDRFGLKQYEGHLDVMWRFVAGLNGFKNIGWKLVCDVSNWSRDTKHRTYTPFIIRCLFEVQNVKEIQTACDSILVSPQQCPEFYLRNHLDCYAAGYCVAVGGHKWKLNTVFTKGDEVLEMLCCGLKSAIGTISGSIFYLNLAGNSLTVAAMSYLRELQFMEILPQIRFLNLNSNKLDNCALDQFAEIVTSMVNLTNLTIGDNPIGEGGTVRFFQSLSQISTLTVLDLKEIKLGLADIQALSEMTTSTKCLTKLIIGDPGMSDESVSEMVKALLSPTILKNVTFCGIVWNSKCTDSFTLLKTNNNITALNFVGKFNYTFYLDPVIPIIAEALHVNKSLQTLRMPPYGGRDDVEEEVRITHESIIALSRMLKVNTTLKRLDIFAPLSCDDIAFLADALRFNYTLKKLNISNDRVTISHYSDSDSDEDTIETSY